MAMFIPDTFMAKRKGQAITAQELEALVGGRREDRKYALRLTALAAEIMKRRRATGDTVTIAQHKDELRFLTDADASVYLAQQNEQGVRRIRRSMRSLREVKTAGLSESERQRHDRILTVSGARVAVLGTVRQAMIPRAHQREVPGVESYAEQTAK